LACKALKKQQLVLVWRAPYIYEHPS
jgi:hypothetical protein